MLRALERSLLAGLALLLAGCSPSALMERLPAGVGGLPADAPKAPQVPYQYPAVQDAPPSRPDKPLTAAQQYELAKDLQAVRARLERQKKQVDPPAGKNDAQRAKKKAGKRKKPENTGATTNP